MHQHRKLNRPSSLHRNLPHYLQSRFRAAFFFSYGVHQMLGDIGMENETAGFEEIICEDEALGMPTSDVDSELIGGSLLQRLDNVFAPLMGFCAESNNLSSDRMPPLDNDFFAHATPEQLRAESMAAVQKFKQMKAALQPQINKAGKIVPRKGEDVVYVGFDAEWEAKSKGRNHILSAQFHLVGPAGKIFEKVFDMSQVARTGDRLRLADALYEVLDEAEADGVVDVWPREVVLVGFFTRADITVFSDFYKLRPQLDGVGGTMASVKGAAKVELPMGAEHAARIKSRYSYVVGDSYDPMLLNVRLVDASSFAPPGTSLQKLGEMLGMQKIDLPPGYTKDKMGFFQQREPKKFEAYGLRDAEIAVWYVLWVLWFSERYLGLSGLSATVSSLGVRFADKCMRSDGIALDVALNYEQFPIMRFDKNTGVPRRSTERLPSQTRGWLEKFLADCYQGGRNECYKFGPTRVGKYIDPDLAGAYVTTLVELKALDYNNARTSTNLTDYVGHVAGFAAVKFRFPDGTRFPCLPVNAGERGLMFPMSGVSLCTAPEIELAISMGAKLTVQFGYVIPWADRADLVRRTADLAKSKKRSAKIITPEFGADAGDALAVDEIQEEKGYRPFKSFAIGVRELRSKFRRKTLPFEFVKLLGNAMYGKTGQGFREKRTFGPRDMASVKVGLSRISEPAIAALVCGMVRAVVGEMLAKLPADVDAVSCTTDGMIIAGDMSQLDLSGAICTRFQELVDMVTPGMPMLENKHTVKQIVAMRTRGQLTGLPYESEPIVLAKTSVRPPREEPDPNAWMLKLFAERVPGQTMERESFISMRDQLIKGWDLQMERAEVKLNLEFDFKRKPVNPRIERIALTGVDHVAFDTLPWDTAEQAVEARLLFDGWRRGRCLKSLADYDDWQAYYALKISNARRGARSRSVNAAISDSPDGEQRRPVRGEQGRVYRTQKTGYVGIAHRAFLKAYVQRRWGLTDVDMTQAALAEWLTEQGYPTKLSSVKNAIRSKVHDEAVPRVEEVERFVGIVCSRFPSLQRDQFFIKMS